MSKPKWVLQIHPDFFPVGGGELVAVGSLLGLSAHHETVLFTSHRVDFGPLDRALGTGLAAAPVTQAHPAPAVRALLRSLPARAHRLKMALFVRAVRAYLADRPVDLVVSTIGEVDLGRRCLQYVHYPLADSRGVAWRSPYHWLCDRVSPWRHDRIRANFTLTNSRYTAGAIRAQYGTEAVVVYPPLPVASRPERAWEDRPARVLCLGRLDVQAKELLKVISIVRAVREAGKELVLTIAGHQMRAGDTAQLRAQQARYPWLEVCVDPDRQQLQQIMYDSRFGLHGMVGEHFGIVVAEFLRAGLIPFVPAQGGAAEILGSEPGLLYQDYADAVSKIKQMLQNELECQEVRRRLALRAEIFSMERFQREFLGQVERQLQDGQAGHRPAASC